MDLFLLHTFFQNIKTYMMAKKYIRKKAKKF